jgi:hypothetical protein
LIVAQDAFVVLQKCIEQTNDLSSTIETFTAKASTCHLKASADRYLEHIEELRETGVSAPALLLQLAPLRAQALRFWLCAPIDYQSQSHDLPAKMWNHFAKKKNPLPSHIEDDIFNFKVSLCAQLERTFPDLLAAMEAEAEAEAAQLGSVGSSAYDVANYLPLGCVLPMSNSPSFYILTTRFPNVYLHCVAQSFAQLLGYSVSRILATPFSVFAIDNLSLVRFLEDANRGDVHFGVHPISAPHPTSEIVSYRTSRRQVCSVLWEVSTDAQVCSLALVGVNITDEIEKFKEDNSTSTQKMLRQWLHSIRNASFEQQAVVLLDEVIELHAALGAGEPLEPVFESLKDGLSMLMQTARRSVGLIDHALDTRGFIQLMAVHDFIENLRTVAEASTDSRGHTPTEIKIVCTLNGAVVLPADIADLFVKCDIFNIQAFVNTLIEIAVK